SRFRTGISRVVFGWALIVGPHSASSSFSCRYDQTLNLAVISGSVRSWISTLAIDAIKRLFRSDAKSPLAEAALCLTRRIISTASLVGFPSVEPTQSVTTLFAAL